MADVLISIKPEFAEKILSGEKRYEYRKQNFHRIVDKLVVYASHPVGKVIGEAKVINLLESDPETIWHETYTAAGIDKARYDEYFKGRDTAVAICLGEVKRYKKPLNLSDYEIERPPQSYLYLK